MAREVPSDSRVLADRQDQRVERSLRVLVQHETRVSAIVGPIPGRGRGGGAVVLETSIINIWDILAPMLDGGYPRTGDDRSDRDRRGNVLSLWFRRWMRDNYNDSDSEWARLGGLL